MIHLTFDYKSDQDCTTAGEYLRYHRTFQGLSTRELAEKVGIVPATLVLYENNKNPIKYETAVALADELGIGKERLLDDYTSFLDYPCTEFLQKVRNRLFLTQAQIAEEIGISQTAYSGWERGTRNPRRFLIFHLSCLPYGFIIYESENQFKCVKRNTEMYSHPSFVSVWRR